MNSHDVANEFLTSIEARIRSMKAYAEEAMVQLDDGDLFWSPNEECNSIAVIIKHLRGNMWSRWTDPLTTDGEKPERDRDGEFIVEGQPTREHLMEEWEEGWGYLLDAVASFQTDDLLKSVTIRGNVISLLDGLHRQLFHSAYHVGQIVSIAKERKGRDWKTISIPRGQSEGHKGLPR